MVPEPRGSTGAVITPWSRGCAVDAPPAVPPRPSCFSGGPWGVAGLACRSPRGHLGARGVMLAMRACQGDGEELPFREVSAVRRDTASTDPTQRGVRLPQGPVSQ